MPPLLAATGVVSHLQAPPELLGVIVRARRDLLAEAGEIGVLGCRNGPEPQDRADTGQPARSEILGQQVGDGRIVPEIQRLQATPGDERLADQQAGATPAVRRLRASCEDVRQCRQALGPRLGERLRRMRFQEPREDAVADARLERPVRLETGVDLRPRRQRLSGPPLPEAAVEPVEESRDP
jgi:hypothetical protein